MKQSRELWKEPPRSAQRRAVRGRGGWYRGFEMYWPSRAVCVVASIALMSVVLPSTLLAEDLEGGATEASMCVACDTLNAQLRIVEDKMRSFEGGRELLETTRRELRRDARNADRLANAYITLQGASVVVGVATLPCSIPPRWLKGLIGGASGLGSYVQERDVGQATLASIVGFVGLGVVNDAISLSEFSREYREGSSGVAALEQNVDATIRRFDGMLEKLEQERQSLGADLARGGCDSADFDISDLLRSSP